MTYHKHQTSREFLSRNLSEPLLDKSFITFRLILDSGSLLVRDLLGAFSPDLFRRCRQYPRRETSGVPRRRVRSPRPTQCCDLGRLGLRHGQDVEDATSCCVSDESEFVEDWCGECGGDEVGACVGGVVDCIKRCAADAVLGGGGECVEDVE